MTCTFSGSSRPITRTFYHLSVLGGRGGGGELGCFQLQPLVSLKATVSRDNEKVSKLVLACSYGPIFCRVFCATKKSRDSFPLSPTSSRVSILTERDRRGKTGGRLCIFDHIKKEKIVTDSIRICIVQSVPHQNDEKPFDNLFILMFKKISA